MSILFRATQCISLMTFAVLAVNAQVPTSPLSKHRADFGRVPLYFEENRGQTDARARYIARGGGQTSFLTQDGLALSLNGEAIAMHIVGAAPDARMRAQGDIEGVSNYYLGQRFISGLRHYSSVLVSDIRPGIDVLYHANGQSLEYDLVIHPGGDTNALRFRFEGGPVPQLDDSGDLVFKTASGQLTQHAPIVWQEVAGQRQAIACKYIISGPEEVQLQLSPYDGSRELLIDPILSYSTYLAGSGTDLPYGIAADSTGFAYITGSTNSPDFPATAGILHGYSDVFVTKLNANGTGLIYSTFIGGSYLDQGNAIAIDAGNAYLTGITYSFDFPFTSGSFSGGNAAFVLEVGSTGNLVYATALGGNNYSNGTAIAVDTVGDAYVTGSTSATNFPVTQGALKTVNGSNSNAFVARIGATGQISYATYLGGSSNDSATAIAVDSLGDAYIGGTATSSNFPVTKGAFSKVRGGGQDAFIAKLNPAGSALIYATLLGGSSSEYAGGLAIDAAGDCYVTGTTNSNDFPTTPSAFTPTAPEYGTSWYVTKLNATGTKLVYSTYIVGSPAQSASSIAVDSNLDAYVSGSAAGTFSTTPGALRTTVVPNYYGETDAFFVKLSPAGTELNYSTLLGTAGATTQSSAIALDGKGGIYITGWTNSATYPVTVGALQTADPKSNNAQSGFVTKIELSSQTLCEPSVSPSSQNLPGRGGSITFELTLAPGCPWEAISNANITYLGSSITLSQPTHGVVASSPIKVSGMVGQNNNTSAAQTLTIGIGAATFTVNQQAGSCQDPVITPGGVFTYDSAGGLRDIELVLPSGCSWTAVSSAPWLSITAGATGNGPATITVFAGQNSFSARTATLTIDGHVITVKQNGGKCTATASETPLNFSASGNTGTVSITTSSSTCDWSAYSTVSWIELVPQFSNGQGSGVAPFLVSQNPGSVARTGSILIANQTLVVTQSAGPSGSVSSYTTSIFAGGGSNSVANLGDGGPATSGFLSSPAGLAFDGATGNLYIVDAGSSRIRVVTPNGNINTFAGGGTSTGEEIPALSAQLVAPSRIAVDPFSSVYFNDSYDRVRKVANGNVVTVAGSIVPGFSGDGLLATTALLNGVRGLATDAAGNLYIADQYNNRVREVSGPIINTVAGGGTNSLGDGGPATSATLSYPSGVFVDANQNVYIADTNDTRIREVSKGIISTFAQVYYPTDLTFDTLGNAFVASGSGLVWISPSGTQTNAPCCYSNTGGVTADKSGNVYFSDDSYNVVRELKPVPAFCSYQVNAPTGTIPGAAKTVNISITAATGCNWTAYSNASWATITSGSNGSGSGSVSIAFTANTTTGSRDVTLAIAGQIITLAQHHE